MKLGGGSNGNRSVSRSSLLGFPASSTAHLRDDSDHRLLEIHSEELVENMNTRRLEELSETTARLKGMSSEIHSGVMHSQRIIDGMVGWLVGWLIGWLVGWLVG